MPILKHFYSFLLLIAVSAFNKLEAQLTTKVEWTKQSSLPAAQTIYYDTAKNLKWSDFAALPKDQGIVAAVTFSGFGYQASMSSSGAATDLKIKVYCYFNKSKSWVKPDKKTSYILAHEQRHFDISYIAACIFIDRIQSTVLDKSQINTWLPKIYEETVQFMETMQEQYDAETKNGQAPAAQEIWNKKISSMIRQFNDKSLL